MPYHVDCDISKTGIPVSGIWNYWKTQSLCTCAARAGGGSALVEVEYKCLSVCLWGEGKTSNEQMPQEECWLEFCAQALLIAICTFTFWCMRLGNLTTTVGWAVAPYYKWMIAKTVAKPAHEQWESWKSQPRPVDSPVSKFSNLFRHPIKHNEQCSQTAAWM